MSSNLQRKFFGTDGIRGTANQFPMTAEIALKVGMALGARFGASFSCCQPCKAACRNCSLWLFCDVLDRTAMQAP